MSITRRATDKDATWQRAWTVTTAAELASIVDSPGVIGPRHGDIAYAQDTALYYLWRDDDTWFPMDRASISSANVIAWLGLQVPIDLQPDLLANGQLPNAKGTLYTASGPVIIKSIILVNSDASSRTMNLYVKRTTSRRIIPKDLSLAAGAMFPFDTVLTLGSGDLIEGDASAATVVDYSISGAKTV